MVSILGMDSEVLERFAFGTNIAWARRWRYSEGAAVSAGEKIAIRADYNFGAAFHS